MSYIYIYISYHTEEIATFADVKGVASLSVITDEIRSDFLHWTKTLSKNARWSNNESISVACFSRLKDSAKRDIGGLQ